MATPPRPPWPFKRLTAPPTGPGPTIYPVSPARKKANGVYGCEGNSWHTKCMAAPCQTPTCRIHFPHEVPTLPYPDPDPRRGRVHRDGQRPPHPPAAVGARTSSHNPARSGARPVIQITCRCCGSRFPANGLAVHPRLCPACRPAATKPNAKPKPKHKRGSRS